MNYKFVRTFALIAMLLPVAIHARGATFSLLHSFGVLTNVTGFNPHAPLVQGPDGTLYGTTMTGEGLVRGVVFRVKPDGTGFTWLKLFTFTNLNDGTTPEAGLTLANGTLYGTTAAGGSNGVGTVFSVLTNGAGFATLHTFGATNGPAGTNTDGAVPLAGLVLSNGVLYGTTFLGGTNGYGTVFAVGTNGAGFTSLHAFTPIASYMSLGIYTNGDGANPLGGLVLSGGILYGTAQKGGTNALGTIFAMSTNGTGFNVLLNMNGGLNAAAVPESGLLLSGNTLYGTSTAGGSNTQGSVFAISTNGTGYLQLHSFDFTDGSTPLGVLVLSGSTLYGTTAYGGANDGGGTVFKVNVDSTGFTNFYNFTYESSASNGGFYPMAGLVLSNSTLYGTASEGGSRLFGTLFSINTNGSGYTNFFSFGFSDAASPVTDFVLSSNRLYGTTANGGAGYGTVFALNTNGSSFAYLHTFTNGDGSDPDLALFLSGSTLYGTTHAGGVTNKGTVFAISTNGTGFTNLFSFNALKNGTNATGASPDAGVVLSGTKLFGTTVNGGTNGSGALFSLLTNGTGFNLLYSFSPTNAPTGDNPDGARPTAGLLLLGNTLFGTATEGGANGFGSLFAINTNGMAFTNLYSFTGSGGANPLGTLLLSGGQFYGATYGGGAGYGTIFVVNTNGTGYSVLHTFSATNGPGFTNDDGAFPFSTLVLSGGRLYGTAAEGGSGGFGTVFSLLTDGTDFSTLCNFGFTNGAGPLSGLVLSGNTLFGATSEGGAVGDGVVFSLTVPPVLNLQLLASKAVLTWNDPSFSLQSATNVQGIYTNVTGATSPHTNPITSTRQFFRLLGN